MDLKPQAQAVILLTSYFGNSKTDAKPLSVKEWGKFARWLKDHELEPADLLKGDPSSLLSGWTDNMITLQRINSLLDRGGALGFVLEKWSRAGLWVITRSESNYPEKLKRRLRLNAPPVLFGCGNKDLLNRGGIAVVGSRDADEADLKFSASLARSAANQGLSIISGGARGVDENSMSSALESNGTSVGVLSHSLLQAATSAKYRKFLNTGDLLLVSPFNPEAGFNIGNAMMRNKYVYCMSNAAVVVNSTSKKGGTWNGATEDLRHGWVSLWVQPKNNPSSGNAALVQMGARWFPRDIQELSVLWEAVGSGDAVPEEAELPLLQSEAEQDPVKAITPHKMASSGGSGNGTTDAPPLTNPVTTANLDGRSLEHSSDFYSLFLQCLRELTNDAPVKVEEIAAHLELEKAQVTTWLKRGTTDGQIKKLSKPVRYQSVSVNQRQSSLFENER